MIKKDQKIMLMLGLNETIDHLAVASSVCWYSHVLRRENGHVLRPLDFEGAGQRKKGTWKREGVKVALSKEHALCRSKWSVDVNQIATGFR